MAYVGISALTSALWCLVAVRIGPATGFVDRPDGDLKTHLHPAVPLGGVGLFLAVNLGLALAGRFDPGLLLASGLMLALGLADDRRGLSPVTRLVVEGASGAILVFWADLITPTIPGVAITSLLVIVAVNSVNLFDGLDGLAGSAGLISALGLAGLAGLRGLDPIPGVMLAGAIVGFLVFNWHPAKVFLGDNGTYVTGLFLSYLILATAAGDPGSGLLIGLAALGVFLIDLAATILRRLLSGRRIFEGDRSHLYDQLHSRGWSVQAVAIIAATAQLGFISLALLLELADLDWWSALLLAAIYGTLLIALWRGGLLQSARL